MLELDQRQKLYHMGYVIGEFKQTPTLSKLINVCEDINDKKIKDDYHFVEKYPNTSDLKPCPIDYDDCFLKILKENNVGKFFDTCVGKGISLNNLQIRTAYPHPDGRPYNYMPWHRDNYIYYDENTISGHIPPGYKLIYHPPIDNRANDSLSLIPGSHLQVKFNKGEDFSQTFSYSPVNFKAHKTKYIIFNTSLLHSTLPVKDTSGQLRVIYNFTQKMHLDSESMQINKKYEDYLND